MGSASVGASLMEAFILMSIYKLNLTLFPTFICNTDVYLFTQMYGIFTMFKNTRVHSVILGRVEWR